MMRSAILFAIGSAAMVSAANAEILLTVDTTNPTAVVIASTGGASSSTISGLNYFVRLDGSVLSGAVTLFPMSGSLSTGAGDAASPFIYIRNGDSLSPWRMGGQTQTFNAGQQAFVGSLTGDLSALTLAAPGTVRDIYVLDNFANETGIIIGQYQIIPAPGAAAVLGLAGLVATRRRR